MAEISIENEFAKRNPWVTGFVIDGEKYGGDFCAMQDRRLDQFFQCFPDVQTILELGSLEGGHTFSLGKHPGVQRVIGMEGRAANVDRARLVQHLLGINNVEFVTANLESTDLAKFGQFDAVFCVGLLYHLPEPWILVGQIARVTERLFVWTHYADMRKADQIVHGYQGRMYQEQGLVDPLSGMSAKSFWPTYDSLMNMLNDSGFGTLDLIENDPKHPHGPCITLAAVQ